MRIGDLVTVVVYLFVTLGIGVWCSSRLTGTEGYFVGGRRIPGWAVGISMLGTAISSVVFLAYPGSAFARDWSKLASCFLVPLAAMVAIYLFVPLYRRANLVSVNEYLEHRFGPWARLYGCITWTLFSFIRMAVMLFLFSLPVQVITGWNAYLIMLALGLLVTAYTALGGIEAVVWTDVIQTVIVILGGGLCIAAIASEVPDGLWGLVASASSNNKFSLGLDYRFSFAEETIYVLVLYGIFSNIQEFASDQTKVQRYCAAVNDRAASNSVWIGGVGCIPVWALFLFVGTCLWGYYQAFPELLRGGLSEDTVFPYFIFNQLPEGVAGLVIAAVVAAAMSSIDSSLNGTATVVTSDLYRRFWVVDREDSHYLLVARLMTVLGGVGVTFFASAMTFVVTNDVQGLTQKSVLDATFFLYSLLTGGIGGLFFLGFLTTRANSQGAAIGVGLAVLVTFYLTFSVFEWLPPGINSPTHRLMIYFFSNIVSYFIGYFSSHLFTPPPEKRLKDLTWWTFSKEPSYRSSV